MGKQTERTSHRPTGCPRSLLVSSRKASHGIIRRGKIRPVGFVVSPCVVKDRSVTTWIARLSEWQASRYRRRDCGRNDSSASSRGVAPLMQSFRLLRVCVAPLAADAAALRSPLWSSEASLRSPWRQNKLEHIRELVGPRCQLKVNLTRWVMMLVIRYFRRAIEERMKLQFLMAACCYLGTGASLGEVIGWTDFVSDGNTSDYPNTRHGLRDVIDPHRNSLIPPRRLRRRIRDGSISRFKMRGYTVDSKGVSRAIPF